MFCIAKDSIKSVTFGCNTNEKIKEDILNKITDDQGLNNIELWQTKLSKDYYYLEFEKI